MALARLRFAASLLVSSLSAALLLVGLSPGALAAGPLTLVVCAPGYPGSTQEAQPAMDALASATATAAAAPKDGSLTAVYYETEAKGLERLGAPDAAYALVPLPFYLEHRKKLGLEPIAQAVPEGRDATEAWALVAEKGKVATPQGLDGFDLVSIGAYSPRFVRGTALGGWGALPAGVKLKFSGAVLSGLRKAAAGERTALLLDGAQAAALPTLAFAKDVEVVALSPRVPVSVLCAVGKKATKAQRAVLVKTLLSMPSSPAGAAALKGIRLTRFAAVDEPALKRAETAFEAARPAP